MKIIKNKRFLFIVILFIVVTTSIIYLRRGNFYLEKEVVVSTVAYTKSLPAELGLNEDIDLKIREIALIKEEEAKHVSITISAAGDCTLGSDDDYIGGNSFINEFKKKDDYSYFFQNVKEVFEKDDITIVNLETTLTNATARANKRFKFKGYPEFTNILIDGSIEAVNIANNHSHDYLQKGYDDTISNLESAKINYFGYGNKSIIKVNGMKVGMLGYEGWGDSSSLRQTISDNVKELKEEGAAIVIISFHWGIEKSNYPIQTQINLAHCSIDSGADLVIGHHPHVIQGIEEYNGKNIVYSLGNFSFGGNKNPSDKDTFIFQQTFNFYDGELIIDNEKNIIPCSISSVTNRNDYKPTISEGQAKERILDRLEKYSSF